MTIGLDTNIVCYLLDPAFPEHASASALFTSLSPSKTVSVSPTVLHEAYHTLVYHQKWLRDEARTRLMMMLRHPYVEFCNQTKAVSTLALNLGGKYELGGRDSLIIASFLAHHVAEVYTHDSDLLKVGRVEWRSLRMKLADPISKS